MSDNALDLELELEWFAEVLDTRIKGYFGTGTAAPDILHIPPPDLNNSNSFYARFIRHYDLQVTERLVLLLSLIPHIRPQLLDVLWSNNDVTGRGFTEFGGLRGAMQISIL